MLVIALLALVLIGPERLPRYAGQLGALVKQGKVALQGAKERIDAELGDELKDVDWQKLDPRQYDPRRIVKEALLDDEPVAGAARRPAARAGRATTAGAASAATTAEPPVASGRAPFDDEAT
nr:twin-arginine translocase TatA/TatE family subunit [Isoptericola halotolerans]